MYMGVRIRELLNQMLFLNHSSHDKKKAIISESKAQSQKTFVQEKDGEIVPDADKVEGSKAKGGAITATQQM
jgi:hypothetical protein